MLVDTLAVPFPSEALGVDVTVTDVDLTEAGQITAVCTRRSARQRTGWTFTRPQKPDEVPSASGVAPDLCTARTTMR
jgi:hypothetical protein